MRLLRRWRAASPASSKNIDQSIVLHLSKSRIPGLRQLKYAGRFLSPLERTGLYICLLIAAAGLVYMGVIFYQRNVELVASDGGRYVEGIIGNPQYINPLYASLNDADADIERLVFSRLFSRDANGEAIGDLAESYEVSADGKTYTIHLKEALWHNGDPLTADDVIMTFNLIRNPDYKSSLRGRFMGITIAKLDDRTLTFTLSEAYRNFVRLLDFGIMPAAFWQSISAQTMPLAELNIKPIGSGPYRFKALTKSKSGTVRSYTLERNESYYGTKAHLEEITFKFFASAAEMVSGLNNGQLNGVSYVDQSTGSAIIAKNSLEYHRSALNDLNAIFFNLKSKNLVADKTIRQALALAIDQNSIAETAAGRWALPARSLTPASTPGSKDVFQTDKTKAEQLLDNAGWTKNGAVRSKDGKELTISLLAPESYKTAAEAVLKNWESLGIKTQLTLQSVEEIEKTSLANKTFDALLYAVTITGSDPFLVWHSSSEANLSTWSRTDVDQWLTEARLLNDRAEAAKRYEAFLAVAADDVPAIPLYWRAYVYPQNKKIKGYTMITLEDSAERFSNAADWYINVNRRLKK